MLIVAGSRPPSHQITEHIRDVKDKYKDAKKAEKTKEFFDTGLPDWMGKIEKSLPPKVGSGGALIGTSLSLADVTVFVFIKECVPPSTASRHDACPTSQRELRATWQLLYRQGGGAQVRRQHTAAQGLH